MVGSPKTDHPGITEKLIWESKIVRYKAEFCQSSASMVALNQVTHTVPIVFVQVADPVGAGFVASLARPGGNASGFTIFEYGVSGKWVELLKEIAPRVKLAAVLR